jgi:hypothetical protein
MEDASYLLARIGFLEARLDSLSRQMDLVSDPGITEPEQIQYGGEGGGVPASLNFAFRVYYDENGQLMMQGGNRFVVDGTNSALSDQMIATSLTTYVIYIRRTYPNPDFPNGKWEGPTVEVSLPLQNTNGLYILIASVMGGVITQRHFGDIYVHDMIDC